MLGSRVRAPEGARKEFRNELLFCYMSENEHFGLKWGIGEFIRKNQKWLVNLLVNR